MTRKAKIRFVTYGGYIGWFLRKYFSKYTSWFYLNYQFIVRNKLYKKYILYFKHEKECPLPCLISIETINRCNGTCTFCPANKDNDQRPFLKMSEELFKKIIDELSSIKYDGYLNLYVNNEPFMDKRIESWYQYAKEQLPSAKTLMYTNGNLLTLKKFKKIIPYIDKMIINNYSNTLKMHDNIKKIYDYVMEDKDYWDKDITIQIRYEKEILTNRAGASPNKKIKKEKHFPCIMPFTDFTIYPNGKVGLCCNDALEKTNLGNLKDNSIMEIWTSQLYGSLRSGIGEDREKFNFCKGCDFVDAGIRNTFIKQKLYGSFLEKSK